MKLFLIFFTAFTISAYSQDCDKFLYLQPHKTIEMSIYNKKEKFTGKNIYKVQEVTTANNVTSGTVNSEMVNEKGKVLSSNVMKIECKEGVYGLDMSIFIPQEQEKQFQNATATAEKVYIEYPSVLQPQQKLKDGNFLINMDNHGLKQSLNIYIYDRLVEDKEKVTTPAGTWEAFRISSKSKITIETMGIPINLNFDGVEWFVPGVGTIKTKSKYGTTEISSIK